VADGRSENASVTLAKAVKSKIEVLKEFPIHDSLGLFYSSACAYCGLGEDAPGKFMGLAAFGTAEQRLPINFDIAIGEFHNDINEIKNTNDPETIKRLYIEYFKKNNYPFAAGSYKKYDPEKLMYYINFASSAQKCLETNLENLVVFLKSMFNSENLILAGGVALNCTSNGKLDGQKLFCNIFAHPASNDAGCSIGAALNVFAELGYFSDKVPQRIQNVFYGKSSYKESLELLLNNISYDVIKFKRHASFVKKIANILANNKIVAWFQERGEFGPRALGHRSILANPADRKMLYKVNELKGREKWRPISPIVLDKYYKDVFVDESPHNLADFMLKTVKVRERWNSKIPAVIHSDYTARPQILNREQDPLLYDVLDEFYSITGIPAIMNTSLNGKDQPIVNEHRHALAFFEKSDILDFLVIDGNIVAKNGK
jgi:carbamoyltransferase